MLTTKQLEQMNNSEFEEYCEKEYKPFFNHLKNVNANYFFKKKRIIVEFHENSQYKVILSKEKGGDFISALLKEKEINYIEFKSIVFPPNLTIKSKNKPISTLISKYPKQNYQLICLYQIILLLKTAPVYIILVKIQK